MTRQGVRECSDPVSCASSANQRGCIPRSGLHREGEQPSARWSTCPQFEPMHLLVCPPGYGTLVPALSNVPPVSSENRHVGPFFWDRALAEKPCLAPSAGPRLARNSHPLPEMSLDPGPRTASRLFNIKHVLEHVHDPLLQDQLQQTSMGCTNVQQYDPH